MRTSRNLRHLSLLCLVSAFLAAACSGSSPTDPGGPLIFAGKVGFQGNSSHDFTMPEDGIVNITLSDLNPLLFDTTRGSVANLVIGFGLGSRNANNECILSSNFALSEGQLTVFRLARRDYCMSIFDVGTLPEDSLLSYTVEAAITF